MKTKDKTKTYRERVEEIFNLHRQYLLTAYNAGSSGETYDGEVKDNMSRAYKQEKSMLSLVSEVLDEVGLDRPYSDGGSLFRNDDKNEGYNQAVSDLKSKIAEIKKGLK